MCRENKSETFDLLQFKNKSHNPLGCQNGTRGCPHFQRARACTIMTAEARLIGPRHINPLERLPAGIHLRTVPRLAGWRKERCPCRFLREMQQVLFSGNIQRCHFRCLLAQETDIQISSTGNRNVPLISLTQLVFQRSRLQKSRGALPLCASRSWVDVTGRIKTGEMAQSLLRSHERKAAFLPPRRSQEQIAIGWKRKTGLLSCST